VLAADIEGVSSLYETDLSGPTAVLFGNEAYGVPPDIGALADHTVRVPIHRAESLNLAAAATLFFFEAARRRSGSALANVVAGTAHDIRSPIAAIRGFGTTLTRRWDRLTEDQKLMMVESILHDAGRLASIVDQLVDAARMEAGTLHLALAPVDLLEVSERLRDERDRMGLPPVEVSGERAMAMADPDRVRTILHALVESAGWWGEEGPVRIEVRSDPGPFVRVWRAVTALEPDGARSLFEPHTPGSGQGSKVGLFVAKGLARAHGGTLDVSVEDGLAFTLGLAPGGGR
jgi:signal transduction histidine kinase